MTFIDLESCKKFVEAEQMLYKEVPLLRKFQKDYLDLNLIRYLINQFKNVKPKTSLWRYSKFVESYFFKEKNSIFVISDIFMKSTCSIRIRVRKILDLDADPKYFNKSEM